MSLYKTILDYLAFGKFRKSFGVYMKKLVILGAGTGGTMMANKLVKKLNRKEWEITIVDQDNIHHYQPGYLFIPFGMYETKDILRDRKKLVSNEVNFILSKINAVDAENSKVILDNGIELIYDFLIIASGASPVPTETDGLTGEGWYKNAFDFYTLEGSIQLQNFLKKWKGGKLVINIVEMPIKCPVAPLEFAFLADSFFTQNNIRDNVEIEYVTPLDKAFTKPVAAATLGHFLEEKNIKIVPDFATGSVDYEKNKIISYDNRSVDFDLLVSIPTNMGAKFIEESGLGNELNFVPTDKQTLRAKGHDNIFVIGDATDLPSSKAGSVVHFQSDVLTHNFLNVIEGKEPDHHFDGHANCYVESGFGKGLLIDFNYETQPLPGKYPLPFFGPFSLLKESRINHWGKLSFKWIYFNLLLKGIELPVPNHMSMMGKEIPQEMLK